jgi:hypothetical protein
MMGVSGASAADQAGLRCNKFEVRFIAMPARLADREFILLDFSRSGVDLKLCRRQRGIIGCDRR